jgi:hypothetical protein
VRQMFLSIVNRGRKTSWLRNILYEVKWRAQRLAGVLSGKFPRHPTPQVRTTTAGLSDFPTPQISGAMHSTAD